MKRPLLLCFLAGVSLLPTQSAAQKKTSDATLLTTGKTLEHEISGGQTQSYLLTLKKGQFLRAVVTSHNVDVAVTLRGSYEQKLLSVDLLKYPGPEPVSFEASEAGEYKLEIRANTASIVHGRYELVSVIKPQAQEVDKQRLTAESLLIEADSLESLRSKESQQASIDKRSEAQILWQKLNDKYWEACTLHFNGRTSATLNKSQEALALYNQALMLRRQIADRIGESATLNNLGLVYEGLGEKEKALDCLSQSITVSKAIGDLIGEARTFDNLGNYFDRLGDQQRALELYNQAIALRRAVGDRSGEAETLTHLAGAYAILNDNQKALELYNQAMPLSRSVSDESAGAKSVPLVLGVVNDRQIVGNEVHLYTVSLKRGEFVHIVAQQLGIDIVVSLRDSLGTRLAETDRPNGSFGPESLSFVASKNGEYQLIVQPLDQSAWNGHYQIRLDALHAATSQDLDRIAAEETFRLGMLLSSRGRNEALLAAVKRYQEALDLWQKLGDYYEQALTLQTIAFLVDGLPDGKPRTKGSLVQALALWNKAGDQRMAISLLQTLAAVSLRDGDKRQAFDFYAQSIELAREVKDQTGEMLLPNQSAARDFLRQGLAYQQATGDKNAEAYSFYHLGWLSFLGVAWSKSARDEAREYYENALENKRLLKDPDLARVLSDLGRLHYWENQNSLAAASYLEALTLKHKLGDSPGEAQILSELAFVYFDSGRHQEAIDSYESALAKAAADNNPSLKSVLLNNLGLAHFSLKHFEKAENCYVASLATKTDLRDVGLYAIAASNLGEVYRATGQYEKAIDSYDQSIGFMQRGYGRLPSEEGNINVPLIHIGAAYDSISLLERPMYRRQIPHNISALKENDPELNVVAVFNNRGLARQQLGKYADAIADYEQALRLIASDYERDPGVIRSLAGGTILNNMGSAYRLLADNQRASHYYNLALVLMSRWNDQAGIAAVLNNLGSLYDALGYHDRALEYYDRALAATRNVKAIESYQQDLSQAQGNQDRAAEGVVLNNIGAAYDRQSDYEKAITYYEQALTIRREVRDRAGEGDTINNLGKAYRAIRRPKEAVKLYEQALTIRRQLKDKAGEAITLHNLMVTWADLYSLPTAIFYGKQAVNAYQQLRNNIKELQKDTQQTYLDSIEGTYRTLADLLISEGRLPEAEQVLDLLKDEEYSSLRRRDDPKSTVVSSAAETIAATALDHLGEIGREANELRDQQLKKTLDEKGKERLGEIERDLLPKANAEFRAALAAIEKEAPAAVVKTAEVKEAQSLMRYLRELGPGTVALYTVVSTEAGKSSKGWVILVTPSFRKAYEMDVSDLDQTVAEFRQTLRSPAYDPQPLAQKLYRVIFLNPQKEGKTLAEDLNAYLLDQKDKTLMWSLDGVLRYVPMTALHDGEKYLVETYRNVVFTPASLPGLTHATNPKWNALGLGVAKQYERFTALSGVPKELSAIVRDGQKHTTGVLPGTILWDDEFKEKAMMDSLSEGYNVVHFASHFSYQAEKPDKSFLLLGDGGHLEMSKIQDMTTLFEKADLVTLSACDTAVGGAMRDANGKDVEGFAYITQKLGAMSVIASLWPVDDIGTQVLMPEFYRLHETGASKAEAFQRAQLILLHGDVKEAPKGRRSVEVVEDENNKKDSALTKFIADPKRPFAHPYYWAPFILIGNWK